MSLKSNFEVLRKLTVIGFLVIVVTLVGVSNAQTITAGENSISVPAKNENKFGIRFGINGRTKEVARKV